MSDIYSPALLVSLIAASVALLAAGVSRWQPARGEPRRMSGWTRSVGPAALVSLAALGVALGSHLLLGHRPGSEQALPPFAFVAAHPAAAVAGVTAVVAWMLHGGGRRRADRRSGPGRSEEEGR